MYVRVVVYLDVKGTKVLLVLEGLSVVSALSLTVACEQLHHRVGAVCVCEHVGSVLEASEGSATSNQRVCKFKET